jgi:triacylglycerol lipase
MNRVAVPLTFAVVLIAATAVVTSVSAGSPDPVLLVHGYRGSPSSWADMKTYLEGQGREVYAIDLPGENNIDNAKAIAAKLRELRWTQVDIVGQSMGGLSARWFTKFVAKGTKVDAYVSLGTPQYGIWSACTLPSWYGGQMCPNSSFLARLNKGDDTPGDTSYTTIYSTGDWYVPNNASRLDGGACFVQVDGISHNDMDNVSIVQAATAEALDGVCSGTFRE